MEDSIEHMEWRYAVKKFDAERNLSAPKVEKLKMAFNLTATSYGLQPIRMVVVQNKTIQEALVAHSYGQEQVAQASHVLVLCIENVIDKDYITAYFEQVAEIRGTSSTILEPFKDSLVANFSQKEVSEVRKWATNQAYLAMGNLLTICAMEKIDSCPMEGFVPQEYDRILQLKEKGLSSVLVMPVGYRAEDDMFADFKKVRKDIKESIIELR
ncbi:nitroreductase family protein [Maribacter sp. 2-571]|uniref:nitroreductase family protein n=1 Tax=Maribacter sp. 2-571 TaxID=3417569 RepID=UPI003D3526F4